MSAVDVAHFVLSILGSTTLSGVIVVGLSSYLGKIWADRLMQREKAAHDAQLEEFRSQLQRSNSAQLESLKKQLDVVATTQLRETTDKLAAYREVVDLVSEILGDFDEFSRSGIPFADGPQRRDSYNRKRIAIYARMAMFAPQKVMDHYDQLATHLLSVADGRTPYVWNDVRALGLNLINEVRSDIGLDKSRLIYRE